MRTVETGVVDALRVIEAHPGGIAALEISALIGLGIHSTLEKLRILRARGLAGCSRAGGRQALWMLPEAAAADRLAHATEQRQLAAVAQAARHAKTRDAAAAEKIEALAHAELWLATPPDQRIVPAHLAAPIRPAGPRWAFESACV